MSEQFGTVCIVDDDEAVRQATSRLLAAGGFDTLTFDTAEAFLEHPLIATPCCLVLDLQLPGLSGIELQEHLATRRPRIPIVFVSGQGDIPTTVRAMRAGAVDFLCKPFSASSLLSAIRLALAQSAREMQEAQTDRRIEYAALTSREREVLELVVDGRMNKQIAATLGITEATVKVHRGRVMHKLQVNSVAELVRLHARLNRSSSRTEVSSPCPEIPD